MKKFLFLLCTVVSFGALDARSASSAEGERQLCAAAMGDEKRMVPMEDPLLRRYAEEFLRHTELSGVAVFLCVTELEGAAAWNSLVELEKKTMVVIGVGGRFPQWEGLSESEVSKVFVIGVGKRFAQTMRKHLRAVIAHEVAHVVHGDFGQCVRRLGALVLCEHEVDLIAINWVGKPATVAALREAIRLAEWESEHLPISYGGAGDLKRRLLLLEQRP